MSEAAAPSGALVVSNVAATSGEPYRLASTAMNVGARHFTDRTYTVTGLPTVLRDAVYIQTANDDRNNAGAGSSLVSFTIDRRTTVYVAHDDRIPRPAWLREGFDDTGLNMQTSYGRAHSWFKRTYDAGRVMLGGNTDAACRRCSMYAVALVPAAAAADSGARTARPGFYVAPNGVATNDGSYERPWDLKTVLAAPGRIQPGDTVWMRGGRYAGRFTSRLSGTAAAPIVVRQSPGERATVDGTLRVEGSNTVYWGFELMSSASAPPHVSGLDFFGPGNRAVNLVVHDQGGNGIGVWAEAPNSLLYGNLVYNNGRQTVDPGYGHAIYGQNQSGTTRIADNVLFHQMAYGLHLYGSEQAYLRNFVVEGNVSFNNGQAAGGMDFHVGGGTPVENLRFTRNYGYRADTRTLARFGYAWGPVSRGAVITDNYFVGQMLFDQWSGLTFQRNTLVRQADWELFTLTLSSGATTGGFTWDQNAYYRPTPVTGPPFLFTIGGRVRTGDFAEWRSNTGFDRASRFSASRPTDQQVFVRPNEYEQGRSTVIVYNWSGAGAASVDLSSSLRVGQRFEVRNAQTFYGAPVMTGTFTGGRVSIPLQATTPTAPVGGWPGGAPSTGQTFHTFIVLPT